MILSIYNNKENDFSVKQFTDSYVKLMDYGTAKTVRFTVNNTNYDSTITVNESSTESLAQIPTTLLNGSFCGDVSVSLLDNSGNVVYSGYKVSVFPSKPKITYSGYNQLPEWLKDNRIFFYTKKGSYDSIDREDHVTTPNDLINIVLLEKAVYNIDFTNFNTSSVTSMKSMFYNCTSLTSLDLSNFNTSSVTDMSGMFYNCTSLTSLDLSNFNTSSVTLMSNMFYYCTSLTSLDLSNFNTSSVTSMSSMFYNCTSLANLTLGQDWGINTKITSLDLSYCPLTHDSCLDVFNKLADKTQTITTSATLTLNENASALMSEDEIAIARNKGWSVRFRIEIL